MCGDLSFSCPFLAVSLHLYMWYVCICAHKYMGTCVCVLVYECVCLCVSLCMSECVCTEVEGDIRYLPIMFFSFITETRALTETGANPFSHLASLLAPTVLCVHLLTAGIIARLAHPSREAFCLPAFTPCW